MKITIIVPENTGEEYYQSICNGYRKKYGDGISFSKETDSRLIGGFIAEVDGTVYDTSIRSKLVTIKKVISK